MNRRIKKILSLVVAVLMIVSAVPMSSFAANTMCSIIGHNVEMVVTKEATCTEAGLKTERCTRSNCDYTTGKTEVIPLKSHTIATIDPVAPTCDKTGNTAGAYCSVCGLITVGGETIPALGHIAVAFSAKEVTCTENGRTEGTECSVCGIVLTGGASLPATGHNMKLVSYKAGSCTSSGYETWVCKTCGEEIFKTVSAEHSFSGWTTVVQATCTSEGKISRICRDCGLQENKSIERLPHTEVVVVAVVATCTKSGNTAGKKCTVCNAITQGCKVIPATHQADWEIISESTCTMEGERKGYCYVCEKNVVENMPMKDHEFKYVDGKLNDCLNSGWELVRCANCGYELERVLEAQHDFESWLTVSVATCTSEGIMSRTCSGCGLCETKLVEKLPHTEVVIAAKPVTCVGTGANAGKRCTVCDAITQGCEVIPATGHREKVVAGYAASCGKKGLSDGAYCDICNVIIRPQVEIAALDHIIEIDKSASFAPTCTTTGLQVEKCVRDGCGYKNNVVLPITHDANWIISVVATCTTAGKKSGYCTSCKMTVVETIPAMGHIVINELSWIVIDSPSCNKEGKKAATCSSCGGQATETIPALSHQDTVYTPAKVPTCKEEGATESRQCTICKTITVKAEKIEKLPHVYGDWLETKTATCKAVGIKESVCKVCGEKRLETIDRLPHEKVVVNSKPATCTESGETGYIMCDMCREVLSESYITPPLGHNYPSAPQTIVAPTCTQTGVAIRVCKDCINIETITVDVIGHTDVNFDGKCDMCGVTGGFVAENCSCNCHKTGIANIFFKFMLFFQKIFRANATCKCGQAHY